MRRRAGGRRSMSMFPIRRSRCRFARGRFSRLDTMRVYVDAMAGGRPARILRPHRCADLHSDVLTAPVHIRGQAMANLVASTSGTDSDWVVKLIDVYPDEVAGQPTMGGYQLAVAMDIFRGRYRESSRTRRRLSRASR